ncbi:MAG: SH3 domain-containing protein, partial [Alphaproteobacteria bacterium]|nr:SH3 domain-containing protein [Alphaproteobacteria bacterium]
LLLPEARSLVVERSSQAITGLRGQINSLRTPPPAAVEPAAIPVTPEPVSAPPIVTETNATVDVGSANIRSGPSSSAAVIISLPRGTEVTILESQRGWQRIRFGAGIDDTGWVFGDLLSTPQPGERNQ